MERISVGDSCLSWVFGESLSIETSQKVLAAYRYLKDNEEMESLGVHDVVPAYTSLAVYFNDPRQSESVRDCVEELFKTIPAEFMEGTSHTIEVDYNGVDLARVVSLSGLSASEVVGWHVKPEYLVATIGFLPHFPYLLGLNEKLHVPRLESPRTKVAAGSVAIGGAQTGVYPQESPGGWNILGTCDPLVLKVLQPGDTIKFCEV